MPVCQIKVGVPTVHIGGVVPITTGGVWMQHMKGKVRIFFRSLLDCSTLEAGYKYHLALFHPPGSDNEQNEQYCVAELVFKSLHMAKDKAPGTLLVFEAESDTWKFNGQNTHYVKSIESV
jgi:hypothetical protein